MSKVKKALHRCPKGWRRFRCGESIRPTDATWICALKSSPLNYNGEPKVSWGNLGEYRISTDFTNAVWRKIAPKKGNKNV